MKRYRLRRWVLTLFACIFLFGIIYSTYNIVIWYKHINENKEVLKEIKKNIKIKEEKVEIDFNKLKEINPDTIAYLKVNNTNIDYIVVKGKDNEYYLKHNFERNWNVAGWVFGDYRNHFDETDKNLIIYGHNTRDGSMFDTLINVLKEEWYLNYSRRLLHHYQFW